MKTPEQEPNNQKNNLNGDKRKSPTLWWYLAAIALIGIFIGLFVAQFNQTTSINYNESDLSYDTNTGVKGELYLILDEKEVTALKKETHTEAGYFYLSGNYRAKDTTSERYYTYGFTATISLDSQEAVSNFNSIIATRTFTTTKGEIISYYGGTHGIYSYIDYTTKTSWTQYLPTIIFWVVIIGLGIYMFSKLSKSMSSMGGMGGQQMNFNSSRARRETNTKVKFKDVAGCDEVKAELVELVDYFRNGKTYTKLGAKLPKGFLLVGPPGTGKTLLAKAVAGEANVPFYSISGSDFVEMYVGVGAGRVRDMFKTAKQNAPCLIFIDEIDAVGRQRGAGLGGGNDEREQTLNQLLVEMDGFEDNSGVIVMAATNRSDVLDPALTRAGRFDRQITVDLPDKDGREAILKVHSRNKVIAPSVDFAAIASRTVGFSGADLANILNDAAILAVRGKKHAIDMDDIDEAIDRSIAGPAKTNRGMSEAERKRVAFHESGHAIIGIKLQHSEKVQRITIIPRGRTGGHVLMTPENDRFVLTKTELLAQITGMLGGRTSEEIFFGDVSTGASNDIEQATRIARMMVTEYGMSDLGPIQYEKNNGSVFLGRDYASQQANYSTQIAFEIDKAVRQIIEEAHVNCRKILEENRADVELVANTLIANETITAEQIDYLLLNRHLPPKEEPKVNEEATDNKEPSNLTEEVKEVKSSNPLDKFGVDLTKLDAEGINFLTELDKLSPSTSLIILFAEAEDGRKMTYRQAKKVIMDSTSSLVNRMQGLGEPVSTKILKSTISIRASEHVWSQFYKTPEEFGQFVEDKSGVEVVFVKLEPNSYSTIESEFLNSGLRGPGKVNKDAASTKESLKEAVEKDEENKKNKK